VDEKERGATPLRPGVILKMKPSNDHGVRITVFLPGRECVRETVVLRALNCTNCLLLGGVYRFITNNDNCVM
jgi:hypothetical protein